MARPAHEDVYVIVSMVATSKGPAFHGDTIKLPPQEAAQLRKKGAVK